MYQDDDMWEQPTYRSKRKRGKPMGSGAPHIPNKAERKLLTQMMQQSGQTEEEVRASKSNRQKLAAARKSMSQPKGNRVNHVRKMLRRRFSRILGLTVFDQRVIDEADAALRSKYRL